MGQVRAGSFNPIYVMSNLRDSYDVVVVGAGIGGLTCGALLARGGRAVLVAEQSSQPGGCCTSFQYEGFTFDYGIDALTGCEKGGIVYRALADLRLLGKVEFIKIDPALRIMGSNYDIRMNSSESFEDRLVELFPMDGEEIHKYMKWLRGVAGDMEKLSREVSPDLRGVWQRLRFAIRSFLGYGNYKKYCQTTSREVVAGILNEPKMQAIIHSATPCFDPGAVATLPMWLIASTGNYYYPRGGAQALPQALSEALVERGGTLALNARVERILVEGDRVAGVVLSGGRRVKARHVVSNADARQTFLQLVEEPDLASDLEEELKDLTVTKAPFLVSLGVDVDLRERGFDAASIVYNPVDNLDELFGTDPERCLMLIALHSLRDPAQAPAGQSTVQLIAMLPYDYTGDWEDAKESIAGKLIASAAQVIPDLKEHIVCQRIITPSQHERNTMNSRGASRGWYPSPGGQTMRQRTPIRNLYQAGHWSFPVFPGGGIAAAVASGRNAAALVMKD